MHLTHPLLRAMKNSGGNVATIDSDRVKTWNEIGDRVARIAAGFLSLGLKPGNRVAILAHNSDIYLELILACPWANLVMVPLNTRLAPAELDFQLRDAGVKLLCFGPEFRDVAGDLRDRGAVANLVSFEPAADEVSIETWCQSCAPISANLARASDQELAAIFYTGGTTGLPKGVMLSHSNLYTMTTNLLMVIPFDESCVGYHTAPMFHLADIVTWMATLTGATHVFERSLTPEGMLKTMSDHDVTHCFTVPAIIDRMALADQTGLDLSALRYLGYGGSSMLPASLARAQDAFPHVGFVQGFGQTEFPAATCLSPRDHAKGARASVLKSCGQVCPDYEIMILDENGEEVPTGEVGEIVGRGGNVMMGYWNRPDETADVLKGDLIHTRDAGYMDENGYVYITDRLKDMIVTGAENVYSIEVEAALSWHPAVEECAVIGLPDEKWGERVHAVIALAPNVQAPTLSDLSEFCREHVAGYKIPKSLTIWPEPLPRSAAGKVLKRELKQSILETSSVA